MGIFYALQAQMDMQKTKEEEAAIFMDKTDLIYENFDPSLVLPVYVIRFLASHAPLAQLAKSQREHSRFHNRKTHKSATEHIHKSANDALCQLSMATCSAVKRKLENKKPN